MGELKDKLKNIKSELFTRMDKSRKEIIDRLETKKGEPVVDEKVKE